MEHLEKAGYTMVDSDENAAFLKASQNELAGGKVAGHRGAMRSGAFTQTRAACLSREDNYIVDGHHRWAATVGLDSEDGRLGNDKQIAITGSTST